MGSIDVSEVVLDAAKSQAEQLFEINRMAYPDYNYINWRIENLTYSYGDYFSMLGCVLLV